MIIEALQRFRHNHYMNCSFCNSEMITDKYVYSREYYNCQHCPLKYTLSYNEQVQGFIINDAKYELIEHDDEMYLELFNSKVTHYTLITKLPIDFKLSLESIKLVLAFS